MRHTGKIKALKIHKVGISVSSGSELVVLISVALILHMSHILWLLLLQSSLMFCSQGISQAQKKNER